MQQRKSYPSKLNSWKAQRIDHFLLTFYIPDHSASNYSQCSTSVQSQRHSIKLIPLHEYYEEGMEKKMNTEREDYQTIS